MGDWELLCQSVDLIGFLKGKEKIRTLGYIEDINNFTSLTTEKLSRINGRVLRQKFSPREILNRAEVILEECEKNSIKTLTMGEYDYPAILSDMSDPAFRLYYRGEPLERDFEGVAVVGTRLPTWEGEKEAFRMGLELAVADCPVVSGLALGIDGEAHRGALAVNGRTIAVLGSGVDRVSPKQNEGTAKEILKKGGTLISEYPPGTPAAPWRFPARNRIIAGLSQAVIVVQAPKKSGALHTVDFALQEGRDVMITPSGLLSEGTAALERDGAFLAESAWQVLKELNSSVEKKSALLSKPKGRDDLVNYMEKELNEELITHGGNSYHVS